MDLSQGGNPYHSTSAPKAYASSPQKNVKATDDWSQTPCAHALKGAEIHFSKPVNMSADDEIFAKSLQLDQEIIFHFPDTLGNSRNQPCQEDHPWCYKVTSATQNKFRHGTIARIECHDNSIHIQDTPEHEVTSDHGKTNTFPIRNIEWKLTFPSDTSINNNIGKYQIEIPGQDGKGLKGYGQFDVKTVKNKCAELLLRTGNMKESNINECETIGVRHFMKSLHAEKCKSHSDDDSKMSEFCKNAHWKLDDTEQDILTSRLNVEASGVDVPLEDSLMMLKSCTCATFAANMWAHYDKETNSCHLWYNRPKDKSTVNAMLCPAKYLSVSTQSRDMCEDMPCAPDQICMSGKCIDKDLSLNIGAWISREACMPTGNVCKVMKKESPTESDYYFDLTTECMQSLQNNAKCRFTMEDCLANKLSSNNCVQKSANGLCMKCVTQILEGEGYGSESGCKDRIIDIQTKDLKDAFDNLKDLSHDTSAAQLISELQHDSASKISMTNKKVTIPSFPPRIIQDYCTKHTAKFNKNMKDQGCSYIGDGKWIHPLTGADCFLEYPCVNIASSDSTDGNTHMCVGSDNARHHSHRKKTPPQGKEGGGIIENMGAFQGQPLDDNAIDPFSLNFT